MPYIQIHQEKAIDKSALCAICPFHAIELEGETLVINAGCRMCRICVKKYGDIFEFIDDSTRPGVDKSQWRGIAVVAEIEAGKIHPVTFELLGKARQMAQKIDFPVFCLVMGYQIAELAQEILEYDADEVFVYDQSPLEHFRIEPYTAVLEDFIQRVKPSVVLVGGTQTGRSLAPRAAARFRTGLTADCTVLDLSENSDLDQIRPAYGGNIMAHINTPGHRPQFATVRYKIFPIPPKSVPHGVLHCETLPPEKLLSGITITAMREKSREVGIEEDEVLVVAGRGIRKAEDLAMLEELAALLHGKLACTRALVEAGWLDAKLQIGLSGRTVKPKLILTCGVSGAIQFVAGMNGAETIIAINSDPDAQIFKVAHIGLCGDLYAIIPELIDRIKQPSPEVER